MEVWTMTRRALALAVVAVLVACNSAEPESPSLAGVWTGSTTVDGETTDWILNISRHDGGEITGTVTGQDAGGSQLAYTGALTDARYAHPSFAFASVFNIEDIPPVTLRYQGSANADRDEIDGNLTSTIFGESQSLPLNFTRSPLPPLVE